jgi:hypothetical protein
MNLIADPNLSYLGNVNGLGSICRQKDLQEKKIQLIGWEEEG